MEAQSELRSRTRRIVESCGALIQNDHFVYASGEHGPGWIAKDVINLNPHRPRELGALLAKAVRQEGIEADLTCGPAVGGILCAQYTGLALGIESVFAERAPQTKGDRFVLKRRYSEYVRDRRVLLVDDVINTGYSSGLVREVIEQSGGEVVAVATWINRGNVGAKELGVPHFIYLDEIHLPSIPATECSLCASGVPINTNYAHGAEFVGQGA